MENEGKFIISSIEFCRKDGIDVKGHVPLLYF